LHSEVTEFNFEQIKHPPKEGVYIHGLYLDGAAWSNNESSLTESAPKKLFSLLPVILVTAITKTNKKNPSATNIYGPHGGYDCPVYKYPVRTDRFLVFNVLLPTHSEKPLHWVVRGVALLCSTS